VNFMTSHVLFANLKFTSYVCFVAPPPSYDSIFGQVKAARAESGSIVDFFKKFLTILLGTRKYTVVRNCICKDSIVHIDFGCTDVCYDGACYI